MIISGTSVSETFTFDPTYLSPPTTYSSGAYVVNVYFQSFIHSVNGGQEELSISTTRVTSGLVQVDISTRADVNTSALNLTLLIVNKQPFSYGNTWQTYVRYRSRTPVIHNPNATRSYWMHAYDLDGGTYLEANRCIYGAERFSYSIANSPRKINTTFTGEYIYFDMVNDQNDYGTIYCFLVPKTGRCLLQNGSSTVTVGCAENYGQIQSGYGSNSSSYNYSYGSNSTYNNYSYGSNSTYNSSYGSYNYTYPSDLVNVTPYYPNNSNYYNSSSYNYSYNYNSSYNNYYNSSSYNYSYGSNSSYNNYSYGSNV